MSDTSISVWADAWIKNWDLDSKDPEQKKFAWATDKAWEACFYNPELAWLLVEEISRRELDNKVASIFAAGPLEDLLSKHGELMIERFETKAKAEPKFANILGGVWQNDMTEEIWQRVQAVWDRRGWDGVPE